MSDWNWKQYLEQDEKIEWQGQPNSRVNKRSIQGSLNLFFWGTVAIVLAVFWPIPGYESLAWMSLGSLAAVMIAMGLYLAMRSPKKLSPAHYAITNKRALIGVGDAVNDIALNKDLELKTYSKGKFQTIEFMRTGTPEDERVSKYPEMSYLTKSDADTVKSLVGSQLN